MTTRILRSCVATKTKYQIPIPSRKVSNLGNIPIADVTACSYSDIATLRSPSPKLEVKPIVTLSQPTEMSEISNNSSSESNSGEDQDGPWTTVACK